MNTVMGQLKKELSRKNHENMILRLENEKLKEGAINQTHLIAHIQCAVSEVLPQKVSHEKILLAIDKAVMKYFKKLKKISATGTQAEDLEKFMNKI